jgi:hypothetical protein
MNHLTASLIVAACVFLAACIGLMVHRVQPESHRTKETLDVVRLGTGMVSVLASLVLGLLIATAKSSSDTTDHDVRGFAAEMILLNETLRDYGECGSQATRPAAPVHHADAAGSLVERGCAADRQSADSGAAGACAGSDPRAQTRR